MIICTASNAAFQGIGDLNEIFLKRYCEAHPQHRYVRWLIPDGYAMPPSWFKLDMILYHLEFGEEVMWIDADALLIGDMELPSFGLGEMMICRDINKENCGVMFFRPTERAMGFLKRANEDTGNALKDWWEQIFVQEHITELVVAYLDKATWNSYPDPVPNSDYVQEVAQIVHFPGMPHSERIVRMTEFSREFLTNKPFTQQSEDVCQNQQIQSGSTSGKSEDEGAQNQNEPSLQLSAE